VRRQLGVPMVGSLTWEESKTLLSIWAVSSSPLFISNDIRPGRVQPRILNLFLNRDMLRVNQQYNRGFAGDRVWTGPYSQEVWAKPLTNASVAVVLFNRDGDPCTSEAKFNPWHRNVSCGSNGFRCSVAEPIDSPCTDAPHLSVGAQNMTLDYAVINASWFGLGNAQVGEPNKLIVCDVYDVFTASTQPKAQAGHTLGRFASRTWSAVVPPHGSRFLILSNCVAQGEY
jgi:hypothetical protein